MGTAIIVAEKPSAARHMATALGGTTGTYQGQAYEITHLRGHLYEFVGPDAMVSPDKASHYKLWSMAGLPWDLSDLSWKRGLEKGASSTLTSVRAALARGDEIVVATDLDPSGEGDLLFWEVMDELGVAHDRSKTFSRMEFTDEAPASIQKAFTHRRPITSMEDEGDYRKARFRSQWDFASMQFTRIATLVARSVGGDVMLRQGRLKSAMVRLVGDQQKAHDDYVRRPFFQNRFRDDHGVVYTDPEEPQHDTQDQVDQKYRASDVVIDSTLDKHQGPPRFMDLAGLSAMLAGTVRSAAVLSTYQKMYEAQLLSYPRTEDKTITPEQFDELAPLVDRIAAVVGVDPGLLTHRSPRKSHVRTGGAHGANRPGPSVPTSLDAVEAQYGTPGRLIYQLLAINYLATLAPDYQFQRVSGHVADAPTFVGAVNIPGAPGWRAVFDPDAGSGDDAHDEDNASGLGTRAEPFVFEGANKRPAAPSMRWLMGQLERHDVGTGATRTSTYAEVTNTRTKHPLLVEKGKRLGLAEAGRMSWLLLPGTHIGDLALTEHVFAQMREIAAGTTTADQCLAEVAGLVREDMATMSENAAAMAKGMDLDGKPVARDEAERVSGTWAADGSQVSFKRTWSGHRFTDEEVTALLGGEEVEFEATARSGKSFTVWGRLARQEYEGHQYVGFVRLGFGKRDSSGNVLPPEAWCGHRFTAAETAALMAGESVEADDFVSKKGNSFGCLVSFTEERKGEGKRIVPDFDAPRTMVPASWGGHTFTVGEKKDLAAGKKVHVTGLRSKKGSAYDADLAWCAEDGRQRIVPSFSH
ncbi:DNA topoisomerase [Acidipropionibacterium jensenii]|uniref:DNA topoisomerase n=1 Tax=Acidipropionibacterium jensenii TaxID=1749 RepID=UPI00214B37FE|nr:DNA topoisomerase [Acidipropionibacterium jensenii]